MSLLNLQSVSIHLRFAVSSMVQGSISLISSLRRFGSTYVLHTHFSYSRIRSESCFKCFVNLDTQHRGNCYGLLLLRRTNVSQSKHELNKKRRLTFATLSSSTHCVPHRACAYRKLRSTRYYQLGTVGAVYTRKVQGNMQGDA